MDMNEVIAINDQKVKDLEEKVSQLERQNLQLTVDKCLAELQAMQSTSLYFNERLPTVQRELSLAQAKLQEFDKK